MALTVAWMLSCLSTAVGLVVVAALWSIAWIAPTAGPQHPLARIAAVLLAVAAITGLVCLLLTPIVLAVRQVRPPRAIVIAAVVIGLLPVALILAVALASQAGM